ncbi:TPA: hypothetical protein ACFOWQ_000725 [Neisseria meningitidis]|uniref:Uncharacterized protein n=6 Tax=Neisseria meningitidis TaxID=487 RepID=A0A425B6T6_NEIME|nr:hypothetical protein [Neisseria meningitidis]AUX05704.1 hypothetical protein BVD88_03945 [Neisseria meningitidis]KIF89368.1 hypothetical protein NX89_07500 [Neisseria meningitidis]KIF92434.1 hypothetical protein NX88_07970 [Neisseria meningitidis]MBG8631071.1 hypothetical protein [Neisseria meningitidis]MBG8681630.1 hypothetical protein [Neisseria meningitidis]
MLLPNDSKPCRNPVSSKRCLGHVPTKLNIKGRLKNNFQTASLYQKQPAHSKIEVQAAFCDDWKKHTLFETFAKFPKIP